MTQNIFLTSLKYLFVDLIGDIIYFPVWWYSQGAKKTLIFCWHKINNLADRLSLRILFKFFFKPMYGDYSASGRIISFFMRLLQLSFLLLALSVGFCFWFGVFILWLIFPLVVIYNIYLNF